MAELSIYTVFTFFAVFTSIVALLILLGLYFFYFDIPTISGIPEIPNGSFLAGHFFKLGADHATTAQTWALEHKWPVYQIRMGRRRAVVLNSFDASREWMVKNQTATLDRPWFPTFHGVVSATSAPTIGTSPWDERTKKQRRVVGAFTTGPSIHRLRHLIDLELGAMISSMFYDSQRSGTGGEIIPHVYQKRLALNFMMMFCYGTRFESVEDPLMLQILADATTIASFRSTASMARDFIPHLRWLSKDGSMEKAFDVRARRDKWLARMLEEVRQREPKIMGTKKSVAEMLLTDNEEGLTELDVKTILSGLISGGFETIFSTLIITIGYLSTPHGQEVQQIAYDEIMEVYGSAETAFEACIVEEKCPYVCGLVKEALRFYPPLKLLPARQSYKDFVYEGSTIPKGILIYVNAQAANHDKAAYGPDADQFRPERWTDKSRQVPPPYHFAFGAGARMCTAVNMSNRVLYGALFRLILSFKITESKGMPANTHYINYKADPAASNAIPSKFRVKLEARDQVVLENCLRGTEERVNGSEWADCAENLVR